MSATEILCYNKACGVKFNPQDNTEKSCQYHPGVPVFHDALKGWSCCKKRTTDFTDFLKIPGCTVGFHNKEKPVEPLKPKVQSSKEASTPSPQPQVTVVPKPIKKINVERPSADEALEKLAVKVTSSYNKEKVLQVRETIDDGIIKIGTKCRNSGCENAYNNSSSDTSACLHHPGTAVFHEGMKYWSCCRRKTTDFTSFLNQAGCTRGEHVWKKTVTSKVECRYDFHQTGGNVILSVFAKHADAETSNFEANQVYLKIGIDFEGDKHFNLNFNLSGVVDPGRSVVTISATKVEVSLRKAYAETWKKLGDVDDKRDENEKLKEEIEEINKEIQEEEEEGGSDLEGIDDVIFD